MDDALRDNTKDLTELENETPIWEDTVHQATGQPIGNVQFSAMLLAESSHVLSPRSLKAALIGFGLHERTAAKRVALWEEVSTNLAEYNQKGGYVTQPVVVIDEQLKLAEIKLTESIARLIEQPKARDKNAGNENKPPTEKSRGKKEAGVVQEL